LSPEKTDSILKEKRKEIGTLTGALRSILYNPKAKGRGEVSDVNILEVAPTLLQKIPIPHKMEGKTLNWA